MAVAARVQARYERVDLGACVDGELAEPEAEAARLVRLALAAERHLSLRRAIPAR